MEILDDVQDSGIENKAAESKDEGATDSTKIPAPTFGFDEKGTFFLQIHSQAGFLAMIGFLQKAIFWLNDRMNEFEKKKKESALIKPSNKGFGRFNLFK